MTLVPTDESKNTLIRDLIRSKTDNSDNYDEKYMRIKFNSDDDIPLTKTLELHNMIIIIIFVFHEDSKYYPQVFLDDCLYKL